MAISLKFQINYTAINVTALINLNLVNLQCCYRRKFDTRRTWKYTLLSGSEAGTPFRARGVAADMSARYAARASDALVAMYHQYRPPSTGGGTCQ